MKNLTWQNPEQLFVAQELINKVKSKCCGIKVHLITGNPKKAIRSFKEDVPSAIGVKKTIQVSQTPSPNYIKRTINMIANPIMNNPIVDAVDAVVDAGNSHRMNPMAHNILKEYYQTKKAVEFHEE